MNTSHTHFEADYTSLWQEAAPDIAWGTLLLFAGIIAGYVFTISATLSGALSYVWATLICAYLAFASFTVMHDAGHGSIFRMGSRLKFLEDLIGWIASVPMLVAPYRFFQKIHDRHHAFTNDPDRDPDHFSLGTKWYQILANIYYIPIQYHVMSVTSLKHIKLFRDTYASTLVYFAVIGGAMTYLALIGYGLAVLCFAVLPMMIALFFLVMFFDYVPHHPHTSQDRYHNTRIFPGRVLNVLLLGQNYHLIHHMYPRVPWYKYEGLFARVLPDLEANQAPIEDVFKGGRPGFMRSPNASAIANEGRALHSLLRVSRVTRVCEDAVALEFALPGNQPLVYRAGQYVTVSKWLNGAQQTRCYSLCDAPGGARLTVGVRNTPDGLMSGYLNSALGEGDALVVQGPFGDFCFPADHGLPVKRLVLVAGGSGITPVLAIAASALKDPALEHVHLIYACQGPSLVMFDARLANMRARYAERFELTYVFAENSQVSSVTGATRVLKGRLDRATFTALSGLDQTTSADDTDVYICGPEGLKDMLVAALETLEYPRARIHQEAFVAMSTLAEGPQHNIQVRLEDGQMHALKVASNQTLLEVAKDQGVMLPHACGVGTCGTCKCKIEQGRVKPIDGAIPGISLAEQAAGYTLACQCKPLSDAVISEVRA